MIRPMLLHELEPGDNVSGWLASEKLDGFRAVSDGVNLYSRHGNRFPAPEWFMAGLPDAVLDGELWAGRGGFHRVQSAVQTGDFTGLSFRPFDAPQHFGIFSIRLDYVLDVCRRTTAEPVHHVRVESYAAAREFARRIYKLGGEGAVFRNPLGMYRQGVRSRDCLKFRPGDRVNLPLTAAIVRAGNQH